MLRSRRHPRFWLPIVGALAAAWVVGCGDDVEVGADNPDAGTSGAGATGSGADGSATGGASGGAAIGECQGKVYQCGDLLDNDGDGLVDAQDPDCLGPCDNTEESYYGGIPGQNNAPCRQDCYFDQDTGPGNDECYWNHQCDKRAVAPAFPPSGDGKCFFDAQAKTAGTNASCAQLEAAQPAQCASYCGPLTPNGCDCFGCCELPAGGGNFVWLGSTVSNVGSCDRASLSDPEKCKPCTPVPSCLNDCAECELCIGKEALPAKCTPPTDAGTDAGSVDQCPPGIQVCGLAGQPACPPGAYCITGCCRQVPR
jgi:hypothetical protein